MHFPCISQQQVTLPKRASSVWLWLFWPPYRGRQGTGHRILWNPCLILGRHPQKVSGDTALQASPLSFSTVSNAGMVQRQQQGLLLAVFAPPWPVLVHARWQRSRKAEGRFTRAFPPTAAPVAVTLPHGSEKLLGGSHWRLLCRPRACWLHGGVCLCVAGTVQPASPEASPWAEVGLRNSRGAARNLCELWPPFSTTAYSLPLVLLS